MMQKQNIYSQRFQQVSIHLDKYIAIFFESGSKFTPGRIKKNP